MNWLDILELVIPSVVGLISVVVHFFVFHRLKCDKKILACLKYDLLPVLHDLIVEQVSSRDFVLEYLKTLSLEELSAIVSEALPSKSGGSENGNDN